MRIKIFFIALFFLPGVLLQAQISSDSVFQQARGLAFSNKRSEARVLLAKIIAENPKYIDAQVLIGRTYMWDKIYDSARIILNVALENNPKYYDAIDAFIDLEYYSDNNIESNKRCDYGLSYYENDENYLIKKAKNLRALKKTDEACTILNQILIKNPNAEPAKKLLREIQLENMKNSLSIGYLLDYFVNNSFAPWQLAYIQYGRKTSFGRVVGRVNVANRYNGYGTQYELDAYPKFSKHYFGYLNIGYSNATIFPKWRYGCDLYRSLPNGFEASIGFRYMIFASSKVIIYTPYVGKYTGKYWVALRSYITPSTDGVSYSGNILVRKYFSDADNYLALQIGYGNSPDDRRLNVISESAIRLKSERVRLGFNKKIADTWIVNMGLALANEEYYLKKYRSIYTIDFYIFKNF